MIEIIQAGQSGKTYSLFEMHRLRKKIFKDRMQWDVDIAGEELEIDNYDLPETVYILARDNQGRMIGVWRMLPSTLPSMIRQLWPQFMEDFPLPVHEDVWETSRFGVLSYHEGNRENFEDSRRTTALLINALVEACVLCEIKEIYTLYHPAVGRAVQPMGFVPESVSQAFPIDGKRAIVGRFKMDEEALSRIRSCTGMHLNLCREDLPPILQTRQMTLPPVQNNGGLNAYA